MKNSNFDENPWRALAAVGTLGLDFAVCVVLGYFLGKQVSMWMGGGVIWVLLGLLAGMITGAMTVIYLIKRFMGGQNG